MTVEKNYIDKHLYDHLINNSRSMLSVINRNYCYEKVNNTFCRYHNIQPENILGKSLADLWGEDTFKENIKENIDICLNGNIVRYEANFQIPLYGERFFEVIFRPLPDEEGNVTHLLAETVDITDLKITQRAISEMEEEFRRLETHLPIGLLRCKPDGTIIHYNKAFSDILENTENENLEGLNIKDFYREKTIFDVQIMHAADGSISTFKRVPLITFKGREIRCRVNIYVVTEKDTKNPLYADFAFEDSTREIMLEHRLLQAKNIETIGSLAGGIAHDFNNILSSIFGYSEMLLEEIKDNQEGTEMVGKIIRAVSKARELTNQILTFSRQVGQEKIPVNICDLLDEAVSFAESVKKPNVSIEKNFRDRNVLVYADPTQLFRVFMNLIMNALQAMENTGGTLTIVQERINGNQFQSESGKSIIADEYTVISFEDTGTGMEESVISRIFEPYYTTKDVGKGAGLGLSVAYGIITELDGEITVKSVKNKGSQFKIYLPLADSLPLEEIAPFAERSRVLFICGGSHELKVLGSALEKSGYAVDYAIDIDGLIKLSGDEDAKPDVIIFSQDNENISSDILSEYMIEKNIDIPVVLITDSSYDLSKEKLLNSGIAKNVLFKPVSLREILTSIQISLNK
ncbi:MAG TPA: ATP-binding protein [Bacteroidales bacterium]|nr:ATP-binding protein [Bacteroidales bacterium]HOK74439.1 ATP-binding protein [Bacteroidales bacterium]HOM39707.1 ATP-binding protein [Bacteroidales bacterium]HOU30074.1 ATP-binding protein [Bacteroidales bacterium]HPP92011.1 ATP-binding protein [Bacteroidales bacterium]